jgi:hypothetical protein
MKNPWWKVVELERAAFARRVPGRRDRRLAQRLRRALAKVANLPHANQALLFHSAWAMVFELEGDPKTAARHRRAEIHRTLRLQGSWTTEPVRVKRWAMRGRGVRFLAARRRALAQLQAMYGRGRSSRVVRGDRSPIID